ncbi:MAG TPA: retropepsin-like aspartic protease [Verrucomicrobiae bacterium]|jgi:predicted aspartyl protease
MRTALPIGTNTAWAAVTMLVWLGGVSLAPAAAPLATIPINTARERIMVPLTLNGSNVSFKLDTGFSMTMIHPELAASLGLQRAGEITIMGIAGEERAPIYEGGIIDLGGVKYEPRRVAVLNPNATRRRIDGILGSGLFRQFVVEIDFAAKRLSLHARTNFSYSGQGEIVPLRFRRGHTTPIVSGTIFTTNGTQVRGEFEIDTGCDSGVCLGHDFVAANRLLADSETRGGVKVGVGGGVRTRSGHLPQLQLGNLKIEKADADFFLESSPVDEGLAGHIGMGVFKRFKVIFDYSRQQMILERP